MSLLFERLLKLLDPPAAPVALPVQSMVAIKASKGALRLPMLVMHSRQDKVTPYL
jgi:hypothetical protein